MGQSYDQDHILIDGWHEGRGYLGEQEELCLIRKAITKM
jgi:hypothetical protein